jgi:hypothetical protein
LQKGTTGTYRPPSPILLHNTVSGNTRITETVKTIQRNGPVQTKKSQNGYV